MRIAVIRSGNAHRHQNQSMVRWRERVRAGRNAGDHRRRAFGCNGDVERRFGKEPTAVGHAQGEIRGRCATGCRDIRRDVAEDNPPAAPTACGKEEYEQQ